MNQLYGFKVKYYAKAVQRDGFDIPPSEGTDFGFIPAASYQEAMMRLATEIYNEDEIITVELECVLDNDTMLLFGKEELYDKIKETL